MEKVLPNNESVMPYIGDVLYQHHDGFREWVDKFTLEYSEITLELCSLEPEVDKINVKHFPLDYTDSEVAAYDRYHYLQERKSRTHDRLWYARESGQYLLYADEDDLSTLEKYIGTPGQLGYKFNLPKGLPISHDAEDNSSILASLPFVSTHTSKLSYISGFEPHTEIRGKINFPLERIISVESFSSWEGRGYQGLGGKGHQHSEGDVFASTSKGHITDMAIHMTVTLEDTGTSDSRVEIIRDAAGEYWGVSTGDCSHRIALAKLLGHDTFPIGTVTVPCESDMAHLSYSVREYFS